jgi:predicted nucleic acid-binding protein
VADFDAAARIYRLCRRSGVTPRGMVDCLIASVAWRCDAAILHHDADLARVTGLLGVATDPASLAV